MPGAQVPAVSTRGDTQPGKGSRERVARPPEQQAARQLQPRGRQGEIGDEKLPPVCKPPNVGLSMSYLHCPTCKKAYNVAISTQCPNCPVPVQAVDAAEDILIAAEALARAMARATPDERSEARRV